MRFRSITMAAVLAVTQLSVSGQMPMPRKPDLALKVMVNSAYTGEDETRQKAHQEVADILNEARLGVPNDRLLYFQNRPTPTNTPFVGWLAGVLDVSPRKGGGLIVTLQVKPKFDGVYDNNELHERYSIVGGKIRYLGYIIPPSANDGLVQTN